MFEKHVRLLDVQDDATEQLYQLHQFLHGPAAEPARKVLASVAGAVGTLNSAATALVYDSVFFFIKDTLASFPSLPAWTARAPDDAVGAQLASAGAGEPASALPYIIRVANHLWTLAEQQFDSSSAGSGSGSSVALAETPLADTAAELSSHLVNNIARGTMTLYVQRILDLRQLSELGAQQLATDIGYFINFLPALSLTADPALVRVRELLLTPLGEFSEMTKNLSASEAETVNLTNTILSIRTAGAAL